MHQNNHNFGALVISLDFELHWGMRDLIKLSSNYHNHYIGAREAIPLILNLFERHNISATWATVGMLFASSIEELKKYSLDPIPKYSNHTLYPYSEEVGLTEKDDPIHYAPSIIKLIQNTKKQEIATHTFSHYYCLEKGQDEESFSADIESSVQIAKNYGIKFNSIVFPRNQYNPQYNNVLKKFNIHCYRGNEDSWLYQAASKKNYTIRLKRLGRLLDSYINISGSNLIEWDQIKESSVLYNVRSSRFLRPYSSKFKFCNEFHLNRILHSMRKAATEYKIYHLWWHPHNFGVNLEENINFLHNILTEFEQLQRKYGMRSLSMSDVYRLVK